MEQFDQVKHLLPKAKNIGRPPLDNYRTLNAIFWILRTGAPWRDLPSTMATGTLFITNSDSGANKIFLSPSFEN